jgi:hypothetical protein
MLMRALIFFATRKCQPPRALPARADARSSLRRIPHHTTNNNTEQAGGWGLMLIIDVM